MSAPARVESGCGGGGEESTPFLAYDVETRRVLFSTNAIEWLDLRFGDPPVFVRVPDRPRVVQWLHGSGEVSTFSTSATMTVDSCNLKRRQYAPKSSTLSVSWTPEPSHRCI